VKPVLIAILCWLCPVAAETAVVAETAVDNDYFRVLKNAVGSTEMNINVGARVVVALTNLVIQTGRGETHLQRGQIAVFTAGEKFQPAPGEFFEVAFKKNHPPLKRPERWIEPEKNKIVYQNDEFRVFEERLEAGGTRELHSHAQRVVVRLNTVQLTDPRFHETAHGNSGLQVANTVKYAEPVVHVVKNLSAEPLFNIVIEYKLPHE
jgi:hypothetical protein